MIHAQPTWDSPRVSLTLESTDFINGWKIVKDREGVITETKYADKEAAQAAWETMNEELIQPNYKP